MANIITKNKYVTFELTFIAYSGNLFSKFAVLLAKHSVKFCFNRYFAINLIDVIVKKGKQLKRITVYQFLSVC